MERGLGDRKFRRRVEDFTCKNCGHKVKGTGYTDHCSECLWSEHVDVNPGDRKEMCHGMMKPISVLFVRTYYEITYMCLKCGALKKFKAADNDNLETIMKLSVNEA